MPSPIDTFASATAAYNRALKGGDTAMDARETASEGGFADLVKNAVADTLHVGQAGESASIAAVNGNADLSQVVTAVAEAEVTLQTMMAVRDRVIEAYKDVLRMPI